MNVRPVGTGGCQAADREGGGLQQRISQRQSGADDHGEACRKGDSGTRMTVVTHER